MTTRVMAIDVPSASPSIQELLDAVRRRAGRIPNMMRAMAVAPRVLSGYLAFSGAMSGGSLSPTLREQLALSAAQANGCDYCLSAHTALAKYLGLTPEEILLSREGQALDEKGSAALAFAARLLETRGAVAESDWSLVRQAGWNDSEILEIIGHVALNLFTNIFNNAVATEIDFPRTSSANLLQAR